MIMADKTKPTKPGAKSTAKEKKDENVEPSKKSKRSYKRKPKIPIQKSWRGMGHADN
jgi:stalled ribosome alternative rescue factor ArfA